MRYTIEIVETLSRVIEVDAPTEDDAYMKVKEMYRNEKIILDDSDYMCTEYNRLNDNYEVITQFK